MTLFPFKSRWITLFRWRKATPSRICWVYKAKTLSGRGPNLWAKKKIDQREFEWPSLLWFGKRSEGHLWRMLAMDPPGTYSMKMETTCWYKEVPRKPTMLLCLSVFSSSTSSCRRLYSPFASLGLEVSRLTCFTAINWPWLVRPQYTWWEVLVIKYLWISVYVHLYRIACMCKKKKTFSKLKRKHPLFHTLLGRAFHPWSKWCCSLNLPHSPVYLICLLIWAEIQNVRKK